MSAYNELRKQMAEWHEYGLVEAAAELAYEQAGDHPRAMSSAIEATIQKGLEEFDSQPQLQPDTRSRKTKSKTPTSAKTKRTIAQSR